MTVDFTHLILLLAAIPVVAAIALFFYWLGHRHGRQHVHRSLAAEPTPQLKPESKPPEIPSYRIKELAILLDLGILTPEEFEAEKDKLHAGRPA